MAFDISHHRRYHPATNGLAECTVQTFKAGFKCMTSGTVETRIARFLFNYRVTPQAQQKTLQQNYL